MEAQGFYMTEIIRGRALIDSGLLCHDPHYIYRILDYLIVMLRYSGLFGLVCNSPVQEQVVTCLH
ncbi:hypothetical protein N7455_009251 [Penicillium solitum]|uniref:uncharacterized protein n=1 Tax=Penicillium solitum TaxID=60172 RepID=UPI0032C450AB|nr:hypothetical protein N7536_000018 [Penicillium majusculum]KAJ5855303.1 hypothetical protein N7455_009251 [Penicillium solitum]